MNQTKQKVLGAQLNALVRRLGDGVPLTAAQLRFVEEQMAQLDKDKAQVGPTAATDEGEAESPSDLAKRLGVSRQVIGYHRTRAGSPQNLSVRDWRDYLIACGKAVAGQVAGPRERKVCHEAALVCAFDALSNDLPVAVTASAEAAGLRLSQSVVDRLTLNLWTLLAAVFNAHLLRTCGDPYFLELSPERHEDGSPFETELPAAILTLQERVGKSRRKPGKRRAKCPVEHPPAVPTG